MATNGQQMKRHIPGCGKPKKERKKKHSTGNKSGHKFKTAKKNKTDKEGVSTAGQKKPCSSPPKSSMAAASQEQTPNIPCHSAHKVSSISGHPKKSKKPTRQRSPNRVCAGMHQNV